MSESTHRSFHWSLQKRLAAFAIGAASVIALMGAVSWWSSSEVANSIQRIYEDQTKSLATLGDVSRALERQRASLLATIASPTDESINGLANQVKSDSVQMERSIASFRLSTADEVSAQLTKQFTTQLAKLQTEGLRSVLTALQNGQTIEADVASQSLYQPQAAEVSRTMDALIKRKLGLAENEYRLSRQLVKNSAITTVTLTILALVAGIALAAYISRSVHRTLGAPERELQMAAKSVSEGDLTEVINVRSELRGSVAGSLSTMVERFSSLVSEVATRARGVPNAAGRQVNGSHDLSTRTSNQAATLEETASSMEELATAVKRNSMNAQKARQLAIEGNKVATAGRTAIDEVAATMNDIARDSRKIQEIVQVIDGIAFQTNLLALNAAVEAARAGEAGRGFAVVASEVRSLSQRSAAAAKEVKALIDESSQRVETGSALVVRADETMSEIVSATESVSQFVSDIATASSEQLIGIEQVNIAVTQLELVTQQNASVAERAAADAQEMREQAGALVAAIAQFSIRADAASSVGGGGKSTAELELGKSSPTAPTTTSAELSRPSLGRDSSKLLRYRGK